MPPPGIQADNTTFSAEGAWWTCDKVRFWRDKPQTIGGWEPFISSNLTGVCRNLLPWKDNDAALNVAFGTHTNLQVYSGGGLYDITPTLWFPARLLTSNPLTVTVGSPTITVNMRGHGLLTGASIAVSGASKVGNLTPNGTFSITVVDPNTFTYTFGSNAATVALGSNPITTLNASRTVTIAQTAHEFTTGATIVIAGATAVGGVTVNGTFTVTVVDADSYTILVPTAATSGATGGGNAVTVFGRIAGGDAVKITPQAAFQTGAINGADGSGYGAGYYGLGLYGQPTTEQYYLRTWALANYGESLMANPRGGAIYWWKNNTATVAAPLDNSPSQVVFMMVTPERQVLAFGCNEEVSGVFNPMCIRGSDIENPDVWATSTANNAFEQILEGGGRIVGARVNAYGIFVWTDTALYQGTFLGDPGQTYRFDKLGSNCGLISPNAAVVAGQVAFWIGQDRQFYSCPLGGAPSLISSPVQREFSDNLALGQQDKIIATSIAQYGEVWWYYPDARDTITTTGDPISGLENSRYLSLSHTGQGWAKGTLSRTAFTDASPAASPIGVDYDGVSYYHERGQYANSGPINWSIESADYYFGEADRTLEIQGVWPDFENQVGSVELSLTTRLYPQGSEYYRGPYSLPPNRGKRDFRASGRVARVKLSSNASPSYARLGKIEFSAAPRGLR